jgi:hypothetical protein
MAIDFDFHSENVRDSRFKPGLEGIGIQEKNRAIAARTSSPMSAPMTTLMVLSDFDIKHMPEHAYPDRISLRSG